MYRCRCWSRERHPALLCHTAGRGLGMRTSMGPRCEAGRHRGRVGRRRTLILLVRQLWQFWDALPQYTIVRRGVAPEQRPADRQSGFRRGLAAGQLAARRRSSKADWYYAMLCNAGCVPSPQQQQHQQQVDGRRCRDAVKQPGTARWWSKMGTRSRKEGGMAGNDGDGSCTVCPFRPRQWNRCSELSSGPRPQKRSMHEQTQEDVASTLASPDTPQQPARQVPVGSGTGKGGWVWIMGSGQQRQLAARRLTRAPWLASVPNSAARSLSLWTSDPCDAVVVRWRGEGSKGKSVRVSPGDVTGKPRSAIFLASSVWALVRQR